jgi:VIT1/CCC1 family predicted Fe2+/Mn2+ transporter
MSMAAGEYVSVGSQLDTEHADLELERRALAANEPGERAELTDIYVSRGLTRELAEQVAAQLMAHDALGAHARDEIGLSEVLSAKPLQAATASAISFAIGAAAPVLLVAVAPLASMILFVVVLTIIMLAILGGVAARTGGAPPLAGATRVAIWGGLAMAITAGVGRLFHVSV